MSNVVKISALRKAHERKQFRKKHPWLGEVGIRIKFAIKAWFYTELILIGCVLFINEYAFIKNTLDTDELMLALVVAGSVFMVPLLAYFMYRVYMNEYEYKQRLNDKEY